MRISQRGASLSLSLLLTLCTGKILCRYFHRVSFLLVTDRCPVGFALDIVSYTREVRLPYVYMPPSKYFSCLCETLPLCVRVVFFIFMLVTQLRANFCTCASTLCVCLSFYMSRHKISCAREYFPLYPFFLFNHLYAY